MVQKAIVHQEMGRPVKDHLTVMALLGVMALHAVTVLLAAKAVRKDVAKVLREKAVGQRIAAKDGLVDLLKVVVEVRADRIRRCSSNMRCGLMLIKMESWTKLS